MARQSKKKNKHQKYLSEELEQREPSAARSWLLKSFYRPRLLLLLAVIPLGAVFYPKLRALVPNLSQMEEYQVQMSDINFTPPPRWVPADFVEQVIQRSALPSSFSSLDDQLAEQIAVAFQMHPWVESVKQVQKKYPAQIEVQLVYREPVAMVDVPQGVYPVDHLGVLLPPSDFSRADTERYPLIINVQTVPTGEVGQRWDDMRLRGAARLAKALKPVWKELSMAAIRVPSRAGASDKMKNQLYSLVAIGGSEVIWGRAPGVSHPGELSVEQKIDRLKSYQKKFGGFEQPYGPYEIDIRHWQEISRRRLSGLNPASSNR